MLQDSFSRKFKYLRLSLTEKCNFRCQYCLPEGFIQRNSADYLRSEEILNLAWAFRELGIEKIRLTGGEPTLREDVCEIVANLKREVGLPRVMLTTNGYRLHSLARKLRDSGLDGVNVSLDSLSPQNFHRITGSTRGDGVRDSIDECVKIGFESVKVNCVVMAGLNDHEFFDFVEFVRRRPISVRFIELMRTDENLEFFRRHHLRLRPLAETVQDQGWLLQNSGPMSGPAREYSHPDYRGTIGFIEPYAQDFCLSCNRLRVSARGQLELCLFGDQRKDLRELLQDSDSREDLKEEVLMALKFKPRAHRLNEQYSGERHSLSTIGG